VSQVSGDLAQTFWAGEGRVRSSRQGCGPAVSGGDWTATARPATMEGAVRSGYLAIEALLVTLGRPESVLVPDLKKGWLTRWIVGVDVP